VILGVFSEFLIDPVAPITTTPNLSEDKAACDRAPRDDDRPKMPYLSPRRLWAQIEQSVIVGAFSNHVSALVKEQSRQTEYDRLTALPVWARTLGEIVR
jgi:hypothetical protein